MDVTPTAAAQGCDAWTYTPTCDLTGYTPEQIADAEAMAQTLLWAASGRRFGVCTYQEELRSCYCICSAECCDACRLTLTKSPLVSVSEVILPGETTPLDPATYAVMSGKLVRLDGYHWPTYAMCAQAGLLITYQAGVAPPPGAALAMAEMVCELLLVGTPECRLPANAVSVSRQGVTIEFDRAVSVLGKASGLPMVMGFVALTNPAGMQVPSKVLIPDDGCVERTVVSA